MPAPDSATGTITLRGPQEKLGQGKQFKITIFKYYIFR